MRLHNPIYQNNAFIFILNLSVFLHGGQYPVDKGIFRLLPPYRNNVGVLDFADDDDAVQ